jgi:hypothetical protein
VEKLWTDGAFPVDCLRSQIYFAPDVSEIRAGGDCAPSFVTPFACA